MRIGYSTLAFNSAGLSGGNINNFGGGMVKIARSIVAYSPTGGDCSGTVTSNGYNLLRNVTGCSFDAADGDQVGTETDPLDPRLGPLMNNGAGTQTHAIFSNSPAKDTIPPSECGVATDQRGVPRPQGPQCDMGAYELKQTDPPADP